MRIWPFITLAPAAMISLIIDDAGGIWRNSFPFLGLFFFLIFFRIYVRIKEGAWIIIDEWLFVPLYLALVATLWWWWREGGVFFALAFFGILSVWLFYIQGAISEKRSNIRRYD